jgi:hypothetical protein
MAQFLKHIGKIGDRKVAVVFRQVPGEEHMALVVYTELLNQNIHDPLIMTIESDIGQGSKELGDALNRSYTRDGKIILQVLHHEGMMKKVQTSQVLMTPAPNQHIKLSELNNILNEMDKGEEAVKKLAEMDRSRGLQDPVDVARRMRGESTDPNIRNQAAQQAAQSAANGMLADNDIARQRLDQAQRMEREANGLLAESQRLLNEAYSMDPSLNPVQAAPKKTRASAKTTKASKTVKAAVETTPAKRPGRARKETVTG